MQKILGAIVGCFLMLIVAFSHANQPILAQQPQNETKKQTFLINNFSESDDSLFLLSKNEWLSPIYSPNFNFTGLGLTWQGELVEGDEPSFSIRIKNNEGWQDWQNLKLSDDAPFKESKYLAQPFFTSGADHFQLTVQDQLGLIDQVEITVWNQPEIKNSFSAASANYTNDLRIIPRVEWGAEESWRFCHEFSGRQACADQQTDESWAREYADVKNITVHHTAGSTDDVNPAAIVRGIYYWHAVALGWGDIGYNYLIDQLGNVYEGRAGGDGVVAGHIYYTHKDKTNNLKVGYNLNSGSIGIALIGNYQDEQPSPAAQRALEKLTAKLAIEFGWQPEGTNDRVVPLDIELLDTGDEDETDNPNKQTEEEEIPAYKIIGEDLARQIAKKSVGLLRSRNFNYELHLENLDEPYVLIKNMPNVATHRDLDWTSCPGDSYQAIFSNNRLAAQQSFTQQKAQGFNHRATLISQSQSEVYLATDETKYITLTYRNDGDLPWRSYNDRAVVMAPDSIRQTLAQLNGVGLASLNSQSLPTLITSQEKNIYPGGYATFQLPISPSATQKVEDRTYLLALNNEGYFSNSEVNVRVHSAQLPYDAEISGISIPPAIRQGWQPTATLEFTNTGSRPWQKGEVQLWTSDLGGRESVFSNKNWPNAYGAIDFEEDSVAPGQNATFIFKVLASRPGLYRNLFQLYFADEVMANSTHQAVTRIDSPYQGEIVEDDLPKAMLKAWRPTVTLKIKNTGSINWSKSNAALKVYGQDKYNSIFYDPGDWVTRTFAAGLVENRVKPGGTGTFQFRLRPSQLGNHPLWLELKVSGRIIYLDGQAITKHWLRVD